MASRWRDISAAAISGSPLVRGVQQLVHVRCGEQSTGLRAFIHRNDQRCPQDQAFQEFLDHKVCRSGAPIADENSPDRMMAALWSTAMMGIMFAIKMCLDLCSVFHRSCWLRTLRATPSSIMRRAEKTSMASSMVGSETKAPRLGDQIDQLVMGQLKEGCPNARTADAKGFGKVLPRQASPPAPDGDQGSRRASRDRSFPPGAVCRCGCSYRFARPWPS